MQSSNPDVLMILKENLQSLYGRTEYIWVHKDKPELYNKHTQYVKINLQPREPMEPKQEPRETKIECKEPKQEPRQEPIQEPIQEPKQEPRQEQEPKQEPKQESRQIRKSQKKDNTPLPLDIILQESNTFPIYVNEIKAKLIETISQKEYIKVFGTKKTAEMMSALTANKWNKSLALFVSFLFDKTVIYKTPILYNAEKNNGTIQITGL